ncbi:MAG: hypothetical protein IT393_04220 [Nitrospirae bacterium]|nr:hypothetical protein [Nitrospirota bacterium]
MKVKKVKIGIKSLEQVFDDVKTVVKRIEQGERLKPVKGPEIYFTSFDALRKGLTSKRLELLHIIKTQKPSSINELGRMAKRDIKNVAGDVKYLERIGLIETRENRRKKAPVINYDRIAFEIAV